MQNRSRLLFGIAALLSLASSLILFKPIFAQPAAFQSNPEALALIEEINALRKAKNLPPYQAHEILMRVAQSHADYIAKTGFLSRYARSLSPYQRAIKAGYPVAGNLSQGGLYAENLHSGFNHAPADAAQKWSSDSQYFGALYATDLEDVGVGVSTASNGVVYFVLDAGSALDDPAYWYTATPTSDGVVFTNTPLEDGSIYHVVQAKEYLWNIALAYNTSIEDLKRLNRLANDEIFEGQKLLIYQPKAEEIKTPTPGVTFTATFGIPTSTATQPVTPTLTFTPTPQPAPPASSQNGGVVLGVIVLMALLGAGIGSWWTSKQRLLE